MKRLIALSLLACGLAAPALAETAWEQETRRLCTSIQQEACWVKMGSPICDRSGKVCSKLPDHSPAQILGKSGSRWHVLTPYGKGWIPARMIMMDARYMQP